MTSIPSKSFSGALVCFNALETVLTLVFFILAPSSAPHPVTATSFYSPYEIIFSWEPLQQSDINGKLLGYKVVYQRVSAGGEPDTDSEPLTEVVPPEETSFHLINQSVYNLFKFKVAALTVAGEGKFSEEVVGGND